jgi:hypothetical protein
VKISVQIYYEQDGLIEDTNERTSVMTEDNGVASSNSGVESSNESERKGLSGAEELEGD